MPPLIAIIDSRHYYAIDEPLLRHYYFHYYWWHYIATLFSPLARQRIFIIYALLFIIYAIYSIASHYDDSCHY